VPSLEFRLGKIVDRLEKSLEIYNSGRKHDYRLSLSIGVTYYDPENPCTIEELLIQADELMYKHKKKKRNLNDKWSSLIFYMQSALTQGFFR